MAAIPNVSVTAYMWIYVQNQFLMCFACKRLVLPIKDKYVEKKCQYYVENKRV